MVNENPDSGLWAALGGMAAIAFGIGLIPLRSVTVASNLAFAFLILTIVIAEVGGRWAGLATALVSALSLNFFLTEPYLRLTIDKPDDIIAFGALVVSGLIAAAFGRRRARSVELVGSAHHDLEALDRIADGLVAERSLDEVLEEVRQSFGLGGLVLRGGDERLVAAAPPDCGGRQAPALALEPRTLLAADERWHGLGRRGFRLAEGGGRLRLGPDGDPFWLDLWDGGPDGRSVDQRRALVVATTMLRLAIRLERGTAPAPAKSRYTWR